jgi:hypothetical protein
LTLVLVCVYSRAMATADSVFLKHQDSGRNVSVAASLPAPPLPPATATGTASTHDTTGDLQQEQEQEKDEDEDGEEELVMVQQYLTSDQLDLAALHRHDALLKNAICETIAGGEYASDDDDPTSSSGLLAGPRALLQGALAHSRSKLWQPVVFTLKGEGGGGGGLLAGVKTLGRHLPRAVPPAPALASNTTTATATATPLPATPASSRQSD